MIASKKEEDKKIVERYAHNYGIPIPTLTIEMVLKHWELEKALTRELLNSTPANRKEVFFRSYNTLYNELPWLVKTGNINDNEISWEKYKVRWMILLGNVKDKYFYEIGSGNGDLISFLAEQGAHCIATELSETRPQRDATQNLQWHQTDGVNLSNYEPAAYFDFVISDQIVEHLHPDDITTHFRNALAILKAGGKYIFYTPSYYMGPGDVSRIFGSIEAEGMHLKEYKYHEMFNILKKAGFRTLTVPSNAGKANVTLPLLTVKSFLIAEKCLTLVKSIKTRKKIYRRLVRIFNIPSELVVIAEK